MSTHGPRMNPARTREVLDKLGIEVATVAAYDRVQPSRAASAWQLNDLIIYIKRTVGSDSAEPEIWRLRSGGGIVANADQVWLTPMQCRVPPGRYKDRGPFWNKTQLEKALRAWKRGE